MAMQTSLLFMGHERVTTSVLGRLHAGLGVAPTIPYCNKYLPFENCSLGLTLPDLLWLCFQWRCHCQHLIVVVINRPNNRKSSESLLWRIACPNALYMNHLQFKVSAPCHIYRWSYSSQGTVSGWCKCYIYSSVTALSLYLIRLPILLSCYKCPWGFVAIEAYAAFDECFNIVRISSKNHTHQHHQLSVLYFHKACLSYVHQVTLIAILLAY